MIKRGSRVERRKKKIASSVLARKWTSYSKNKQNPTPQRKRRLPASPPALLHQAQMPPPEGFTGQPMSFLLVTVLFLTLVYSVVDSPLVPQANSLRSGTWG